jgi:DNA-binding response OmpR family regulator
MGGMLQSKVLVVDDDGESRDLLREVLEASGCAVCAVGDGEAACKALAADGGFGIVITDLRLPDQSGLELLEKLRLQNSATNMVLMSSFISADERKVARRLGVDAMLEKPFRLSELLQVVAELTGKNSIGITP